MSPKYAQPEIERRWLVHADRLPALEQFQHRLIRDKYLDGGRLRLRAVSETGKTPVLKLGKKYLREGGDAEQVVSIYLSQREYDTLDQLPGLLLEKTRYTVAGGALDVHRVAYLPTIFEMEFEDESSAAQYVPPAFVAEEVSFQAAFSGHAFAMRAAAQAALQEESAS